MTPAFSLLVAAFVAGCAPPDRAPANVWHTTVVLRGKDFTVRLKVLARPSLADTEWMALEFENKGAKPLTVENAYYWTTAERCRRGTDQVESSGSLASGNTYDLFPDAWARRSAAGMVLQPGKTYRVVEQPSDHSASALGLPPKGGWSIRGRIFLSVTLADGRRLQPTEAEGAPFAFDWLPPDDAGLKALQARLKRLLRSPQNKVHHAYILDAYLRIPKVARAATVEELVTALARRKQAFEGRGVIVAYLAKHFGNDPAVAAYYRQGLKDGDPLVLNDLRTRALRDRAHVKPLVGLYESDSRKYHEALDVLHTYRDDWIKDGDIVRRLSAVVRRTYPVLGEDVRRLDRKRIGHWAQAIRRLAMTGDRSAKILLLPALDDKRAYQSSQSMSLPIGYRVPPLRVCDAALDAALTLLDGSPDEAYRRAGAGLMPVDRTNRDEAYAELRDGMISALKRRLSPGGKGG